MFTIRFHDVLLYLNPKQFFAFFSKAIKSFKLSELNLWKVR